MRTSQTHPLQIAQVWPGPKMGRIGLTFCPGKKQPHAATGAWDRDLETDVLAIQDWPVPEPKSLSPTEFTTEANSVHSVLDEFGAQVPAFRDGKCPDRENGWQKGRFQG